MALPKADKAARRAGAFLGSEGSATAATQAENMTSLPIPNNHRSFNNFYIHEAGVFYPGF